MKWIPFSKQMPESGTINESNTAPKKYWILWEGEIDKPRHITWETVWFNWNFEAMGVLAWAKADVPPLLTKKEWLKVKGKK